MSIIEKELAAIHSSHASALASPVAADRSAARTKFDAAGDDACDAELKRLQDAIANVEALRAQHKARGAETAQAKRNALETALLRDMHASGPHDLRAQIRAHRAQPQRALALGIKKNVDLFAARALTELGAELGPDVVTQMIADDVAAEYGEGALEHFAGHDFGTNHRARYAIDRLGRAQTPQEIEYCLSECESELVRVARKSGVSGSASARAKSINALRRSHVTHADLTAAYTAAETP